MSQASEREATSGQRPALDVSGLPSIAFGARDPHWWGVACLMLIEATTFVLLYAAYIYIRGNFDVFPPIPVKWSAFLAAAAGQLLLLLSAPLIYLSMLAARKASMRGMKRWLIAAAVPSFAFLAARGLEFHMLPFRWDYNAHASVFWFLQAMHGSLAVFGASEDVVLLAILYFKPVEKKHLVDVHTNGVYWLFTVAMGLATFALLYLDPAVLRTLR
jgi:heme/copper-type cytochrome/quinol oxidase subunit 3